MYLIRNIVLFCCFFISYLFCYSQPVAPVAHWTFSEMTGDSLIDHSGNGNNGQISGATWQSVSGLRSLMFDGVNDYVSISHDSDFNFGTGDFTIEVQFKTSVIPTGSWYSLVSKHNTANWHDREFYLAILGTSGFPDFGLSTETGVFERATGMTNVCDGVFHTVRGVRQGNQLKIYVDGNLEGTVSASINPDNDNPINIGRSSYNSGSGYFNGVISNVSLWGFPYQLTPVLEDDEFNTKINNLPGEFIIFQNYPNPFNPSTSIKYGIPEASHVQLSVFNTLGQRVALLVDEKQEAGYHEVTFDASRLTSGMYFYRFQAGSFTSVKKMSLVK